MIEKKENNVIITVILHGIPADCNYYVAEKETAILWTPNLSSTEYFMFTIHVHCTALAIASLATFMVLASM